MNEPAPLREPFFLRGRKSVLQRAVIISCVLGTLTAAAAWIVAAATITASWAFGNDSMYFSIPVSWGFASALLIYGPLNSWNRRTWHWTAAAVPVGMLLLFLFIAWMRDGDHGPYSEAVRSTIGFFLVLLVSGLLQIRPRILYVAAYLASILGAAVPGLVMVLIDHPGRLRIPGFTQEMMEGIVFAALFGGWFGALSIPWGLPFWWPPERVSPAEQTP